MEGDYIAVFFEKWWWRLTFFFLGYALCSLIEHAKNYFKKVKYYKNKGAAKAKVKAKKKERKEK